ncbi:MAG: hypothetical protein ACR2KD_04545 [Thermoleophilaceae bacterium]
MALPCSHLNQVRAVIAETDGCEDCGRLDRTGEAWRYCYVDEVMM